MVNFISEKISDYMETAIQAVEPIGRDKMLFLACTTYLRILLKKHINVTYDKAYEDESFV